MGGHSVSLLSTNPGVVEVLDTVHLPVKAPLLSLRRNIITPVEAGGYCPDLHRESEENELPGKHSGQNVVEGAAKVKPTIIPSP